LPELTDILRAITEEMQKSLSPRTAVGEAVTVDGRTVIPLMSVGMGFGAGSSLGKESSPGNAGGGGIGIKPVAVVIIDEHGVRLERMQAGRHSLAEHMVEAVPKLLENLSRKKETAVEIKDGEEK
jgi:uncharacterized spore protein YtfJ